MKIVIIDTDDQIEQFAMENGPHGTDKINLKLQHIEALLHGRNVVFGEDEYTTVLRMITER